MAEEYNPNDFNWRFRESLKEHREKLDALPPEKREQVEKELRERFTAHEKEQLDLIKDHHRYSVESMVSMIEKHEADLKDHVDEAHKAQSSGDEKLREKIAAKARQGRDQEREREH